MRPIVRGHWPLDESGEEILFKEYSMARSELINRLGEYCSYCEMELDTSLAVEHIKPKNPDWSDTVLTDRELDWDNFLLACTNCNSTKGNTEVLLDDYVWPDRDNTFLALEYSKGGLVQSFDSIDKPLKAKVDAIIKLVGLNKMPSPDDPRASDRRLQNRRETWDIAEDSKQDLSESDTPQMRRQIVRSVKGYWSVWMTVFADDADMRKRFIESHSGTCIKCFDELCGFEALPRSGGLL